MVLRLVSFIPLVQHGYWNERKIIWRSVVIIKPTIFAVIAYEILLLPFHFWMVFDSATAERTVFGNHVIFLNVFGVFNTIGNNLGCNQEKIGDFDFLHDFLIFPDTEFIPVTIIGNRPSIDFAVYNNIPVFLFHYKANIRIIPVTIATLPIKIEKKYFLGIP